MLQWPVLIKALFRYANQPELDELFKEMPPPPEQQMVSDIAEGAKSPVTTRTSVRVNRPGMTQQGQSQVMQQLLAGGGQPKQAAMMGRPVE